MSAAVLPLGLVMGLVMGVLGAGGSILSVPALVYVLGQDPTTATTTSLVIVGLTSAAGVVAHARSGRVRWREGVIFGALGFAGSWLGSHLAIRLDPELLMLGFAVLLLGAAWAMARRRPAEAQGSREERGPHEGLEPRLLLAAGALGAMRLGVAAAGRVVLAASGVGLLTGLFGVGGGFVVVPMLVLFLGFPMPAAVGTSLVVIVINSATALLGRLASTPDLDWALVVPFAGAAVVGVLVGARLSGRLPEGLLTRAFAALLLGLGLWVGTSSALALA